jgi:hypothetical protein
VRSHKDTRRGTTASALEPVAEHFADVDGERESIEARTFSPHDHLCSSPVQITQLHRGHLTRSQTEARQQRQDRDVAHSGCRVAVTTCEQ